MSDSPPISTILDTTSIQDKVVVGDVDASNTSKATDSTTTNSDATASSTASSTEDTQETLDLLSSTQPTSFSSHQQHILLLTRLAKQLEYYFSEINLAKDTYLQTLRSLNDGCVPVTILANFQNVKLLTRRQGNEEVRMHAILQAATDYSELLRVVSIDTSTGQVATDETPSSAKTILAVGPVVSMIVGTTTSPFASASASVTTTTTTTTTSTPPPPAVVLNNTQVPTANTVILRDVRTEVTQEQVQELFEQLEDCPAVVTLHLDVAHCWFVTLDTDCRQTMLRVMMQLRSSTLAEEPVHARLKATAAAPAAGDGSLVQPPALWAHHPELMDGKKKKKKKRGKKKKKMWPRTTNQAGVTAAANADAVTTPVVASSNETAAVAAAPTTTTAANTPALSLGEDDFPSLLDKHVEWETPMEENEDSSQGEDQEAKSLKNLSDVASTATTTSSSSSSLLPKKTVDGYAAALKRASHAVRPTETGASRASLPPTGKRREEEPVGPAVVVKVAPWAGSRSFVDIITSS